MEALGVIVFVVMATLGAMIYGIVRDKKVPPNEETLLTILTVSAIAGILTTIIVIYGVL